MNAKVKFVLCGAIAMLLAVPVLAGPHHHHHGGYHHGGFHHGGYHHHYHGGSSGVRLAADIVNLVHSVVAPPVVVAPAPAPVVVAPEPVVVAPPPPPVVVAPRPIYYAPPRYYHYRHY